MDETQRGGPAGRQVDETTYVEAPGAELFAEQVGPADAPAVYYLHGGPGYSSHSFKELMGDDLGGWRMVYADVRGGGRSYAAAGTSADPATLADDVAAVLDAFEIGSAVLVGHGFGALIAAYTALAHPERVTGLVLVNPWLSLPLLAARLLAAAEVASGLDAEATVGAVADDPAATADAAFSLVNPKALFDALQFPASAARLRLEHVDAEALAGPQEEDDADAVWRLEVLSRLAELEATGVKTVVIAGVDDGTSYPEQVEAALPLLPSGLVSLVPGGHYPWLDDPDTFTGVLEAALRELTAEERA